MEQTEKVRTIRLYGKLGTKFGREHKFVVRNAQEALRALCSMVDGFQQELSKSKENGIGYTVFAGKRNLGESQLDYPVGNDDIRIAPVILGNKKGGVFQIILGAALIAVAVFAPQLLPATGIFSAGTIGAMGASMVLGGVMQLLSPTQIGLSTKDGPDNGASYNFNSPVNTTAQGNAVPILYGEMIIGGATISASISSEDQ